MYDLLPLTTSVPASPAASLTVTRRVTDADDGGALGSGEPEAAGAVPPGATVTSHVPAAMTMLAANAACGPARAVAVATWPARCAGIVTLAPNWVEIVKPGVPGVTSRAVIMTVAPGAELPVTRTGPVTVALSCGWRRTRYPGPRRSDWRRPGRR